MLNLKIRPGLNQKGITILEIMVSMMIVSLAFTGLMHSFPLGLAINREAENATLASFLAQSKIEELHSLGYEAVSPGTIEEKHRLSVNQENYLYNFQRETSVGFVDGNLAASGADTGLLKITVSVYYPDALSKKEKSYAVSTLIAQR
ncbi:MAG: type II secretion system protein [Patescibacteria group bacterium]|jgi:type II secretory pathway pseudopilin PulG